MIHVFSLVCFSLLVLTSLTELENSKEWDEKVTHIYTAHARLYLSLSCLECYVIITRLFPGSISVETRTHESGAIRRRERCPEKCNDAKLYPVRALASEWFWNDCDGTFFTSEHLCFYRSLSLRRLSSLVYVCRSDIALTHQSKQM